MPLTKNQVIIIGVVLFIVLFFVLGYLGIIPIFPDAQTNTGISKSGPKLSFWGIANQQDLKDVIDSYGKNAQITYQQFDEKKYETALLDALAAGNGPDIFMVHRSWLSKHEGKMTPAEDAQFSLYNLRQMFPDVVEKDFSLNQKVYALPLYLDSLALFYNKDILNAKGIALIPSDWDSFKILAPRLTEFDFSNQIKKAGAAIGGSNRSISNASDILSLIMLQSGTTFFNQSIKKYSFAQKAETGFDFYLQFATPGVYYSWTDNFGDSLDSFSSGDVAVIFDYAKNINKIKQKNPFLNFGVAAMPQFDPNNPINYADYWGIAVSKQSKFAKTAWDFIIAATTNPDNSQSYIQKANLPPALRTLINQYYLNPELGIFAKQALTSKSFFSPNPNAFSQTFSNMIDSVLTGKQTPKSALESAQNYLNSL